MSRLRRTLAAVLPRGRRSRQRRGTSPVDYRPRADGLPDPGEVVRAWVPFEEDASRGKDRPVLLGRWHWMDVGTGGWDRQRRPSEVRLDRLLELDPDGIRREGAALDRATFDAVVAAARAVHPGQPL